MSEEKDLCESLKNHPCVNCDTPPFFQVGKLIIYCGKNPKNRTIQILDLKFHIDTLFKNCPKRGE